MSKACCPTSPPSRSPSFVNSCEKMSVSDSLGHFAAIPYGRTYESLSHNLVQSASTPQLVVIVGALSHIPSLEVTKVHVPKSEENRKKPEENGNSPLHSGEEPRYNTRTLSFPPRKQRILPLPRTPAETCIGGPQYPRSRAVRPRVSDWEAFPWKGFSSYGRRFA